MDIFKLTLVAGLLWSAGTGDPIALACVAVMASGLVFVAIRGK